MRLLLWTLLVGLAASIVHPSAALVKVSEPQETLTSDYDRPTTVMGAKRLLRRTSNDDIIDTDTLFDGDLQPLSTDNEERGPLASTAGWTTTKVFNGLEKVVGRANNDKLKSKFANLLFFILRKKGKTAEDAFALARMQTDPNKRARFETVAKMFEQYLKRQT